MIRQGVRTNITWTVVSALALLGTVVASISTGSSRDWWKTEMFLFMSTGAAVLATGTQLIMMAQARRQISIETGVRHKKPFWMILGDHVSVLSFGAALGAVLSLVGLPVIGLIVFSTFAAFFAFTFGMELSFSDELTLESTGLRIHNRDAEFLVRWSAIAQVEKKGSGLYQTVRLSVRDRLSIVESAQPNTGKAKAFVEAVLSGKDNAGLVLSPWIGGLNAAALGSAIHREIGARSEGSQA